MPPPPYSMVDVYYDATIDAHKIRLNLGPGKTLGYVLAAQELLNTQSKEAVKHHVAKQMAYLASKEIYDAVSKALENIATSGKPSAQPLSWYSMMQQEMSKQIDLKMLTAQIGGFNPTDGSKILDALKAFEPDAKIVYGPSHYPGGGQSGVGSSVTNVLRKSIPDIEVAVTCPCCSSSLPVRIAIIHLNDKAKWTREQIADWLDTLDLDLYFKTPEEVNNADA